MYQFKVSVPGKAHSTQESQDTDSITGSDSSSVYSSTSSTSQETIPEAIENSVSKYVCGAPLSPIEEEVQDEEWPLKNIKQEEHNIDNTKQEHERAQALHALTRATPPSSPTAKFSLFPITPAVVAKSSISAPLKINDSRFRERKPDGPFNSNPFSADERRDVFKANRRKAVRNDQWIENISICPRPEAAPALALPIYPCNKAPDFEETDVLDLFPQPPK